MTTKPLAKSLHTLTVLVQVARLFEGTPEERVARACAVLSLSGKPDPYALAARAAQLLIKGA